MNNEEMNKIIADYMGLEFHVNNIDGKGYINNGVGYELYTSSLDALVPVWEKLCEDSNIREHAFTLQYDNTYSFYFRYFREDHDGELTRPRLNEDANTLQEAAAHATARAILELNK